MLLTIVLVLLVFTLGCHALGIIMRVIGRYLQKRP
jgi:hypothetical protein